VVRTAIAHGHYNTLCRLFLRAVRDDDTASGLLVGFDTTDHDTIVERTKCHLYDLS